MGLTLIDISEFRKWQFKKKQLSRAFRYSNIRHMPYRRTTESPPRNVLEQRQCSRSKKSCYPTSHISPGSQLFLNDHQPPSDAAISASSPQRTIPIPLACSQTGEIPNTTFLRLVVGPIGLVPETFYSPSDTLGQPQPRYVILSPISSATAAPRWAMCIRC